MPSSTHIPRPTPPNPMDDLKKVIEVLKNKDLCAEAMVSEIGEILGKYDPE